MPFAMRSLRLNVMNARITRSDQESLQVSIGCRRLPSIATWPKTSFHAGVYAKETCAKDVIAAGHIAHVKRIRCECANQTSHFCHIIIFPLRCIVRATYYYNIIYVTFAIALAHINEPKWIDVTFYRFTTQTVSVFCETSITSKELVLKMWTSFRCNTKFNPLHSIWNCSHASNGSIYSDVECTLKYSSRWRIVPFFRFCWSSSLLPLLSFALFPAKKINQMLKVQNSRWISILSPLAPQHSHRSSIYWLTKPYNFHSF